MIYCLWCGSIRDKRLMDLMADYQRRLSRIWPVTLVEIHDSSKDIKKWADGKKSRGLFVSLDAKGEKMDSPGFGRWVTQSARDIYFFAWSADGPPAGLDIPWDKKLSLSPMTYSHGLARVLLMEQLYRAGAVLKGHPYPH